MKAVLAAIASGKINSQLEGNLRENSAATASLCNDLTPAKVSIDSLGEEQWNVLFHVLTALLRACQSHKYSIAQISKTFSRWYNAILCAMETQFQPLAEHVLLLSTELAHIDEQFVARLFSAYLGGARADLLVRVHQVLARQDTESYFARICSILADDQTMLPALQLLSVVALQELPQCTQVTKTPLLSILLAILQQEQDDQILDLAVLCVCAFVQRLPDIANTRQGLFSIFRRLVTLHVVESTPLPSPSPSLDAMLSPPPLPGITEVFSTPVSGQSATPTPHDSMHSTPTTTPRRTVVSPVNMSPPVTPVMSPSTLSPVLPAESVHSPPEELLLTDEATPERQTLSERPTVISPTSAPAPVSHPAMPVISKPLLRKCQLLFATLYGRFPQPFVEYLRRSCGEDRLFASLLMPFISHARLHPLLFDNITGATPSRWRDACDEALQHLCSDLLSGSVMSVDSDEFRLASETSQDIITSAKMSDYNNMTVEQILHLQSAIETRAIASDAWLRPSTDVGSCISLPDSVPLLQQEVLLLRSELLYERFLATQRNSVITKLLAVQREQEQLNNEMLYWKQQAKLQYNNVKTLGDIVGSERQSYIKLLERQTAWQRRVQLKLQKMALEREELTSRSFEMDEETKSLEKSVTDLTESLSKQAHRNMLLSAELEDTKTRLKRFENVGEELQRLREQLQQWERNDMMMSEDEELARTEPDTGRRYSAWSETTTSQMLEEAHERCKMLEEHLEALRSTPPDSAMPNAVVAAMLEQGRES